jgi:hypothetical protein
MEKIKVIHDVAGQTLTIWLEDPKKEVICEETTEEVVLMKNKAGGVIGFELLHYEPPITQPSGLTVETIVTSAA